MDCLPWLEESIDLLNSPADIYLSTAQWRKVAEPYQAVENGGRYKSLSSKFWTD